MPATTQEPRISIIMPTYNRAALIGDTIRSIRAQTWQNWELLIMDDGSDDQTDKILRSIDDERIVFYKEERTGIVGRLKNKAINLSKGSLIAFIDSDDLWHPSKLEKQVNALMENPGAGFCLVNGYNFNEDGKPFDFFYKQIEGTKYGNVFEGCFQSEVAGYTQALLVRKECIETAGHFKEDKTFSDFEFIISLAWHFLSVILYEPLVYRRIHKQNYSPPNWEKTMWEGIEIIEKNRSRLPSKIARNSLFRIHIDFGEKYLQRKQYRPALKQFKQAWLKQPLSFISAKKMAKTLLRSLGLPQIK